MLTENQVQNLAVAARKYFISPAQAIALPAVVEVCTRKMEMTADEFIGHVLGKPALGEYVRQLCQVAISA